MSLRLIIIIVMLTAALLAGLTLVWPKFQDFRQIQSEFKQKEAELSSKTVYYSKIKETQKRLEEYDDVLSRIDDAIPNHYSTPDLFHYLQKTAGETGLVLKNLSFDGVSGERVKEIKLNLQASGSYGSLVSFLSAIENSVRFFKIQNISFSSPTKEGLFSFNLAIIAYSY